MTFHADKKREHESAAEKALAEKNFAKAFFHTAKAAEFGLNLAEQTEGKISQRFVEDAYELIEIAERLKQKADVQDQERSRRAVKETWDNEGETDTWRLRERPTTRLTDVAGLEDVKAVLQEGIILPFRHPEVYARFRQKAGGGVLVYGPPGNGKTFIARAIAGELDAAFFPVDCARIKDKYVGETEKNLKRLFDEAREEPRAVLFFDEVESLLERRGNRKINTVTQFLSLTDGVVKVDQSCLLLLAATNRPWRLDEAALRPGRLGTHIYVGLPDANARAAILAYNLREVPITADVSFAELAERTEGYSGADMAEICQRAKMSAIRRELDSGQEETLIRSDLEHALTVVKPSVTHEQLQQFETWQMDRRSPAEADDD